MAGTDVAVHLDGAARRVHRLVRLDKAEQFGTVRLDVGETEGVAGCLVAGGRLVKVVTGGVEVEGEPAGEVTESGDIAPELGVVGGGERVEIGGEGFGVAESALRHVQVAGPQPRLQPGCSGGLFPHAGEQGEGFAGVAGDALAVAGGDRQPGADR